MKKLISIAVSLVVLLGVHTVKAQSKPFTGTVTYTITYPGAPEDPTKHGAPSKMEVKISEDKFITYIEKTPAQIVDYVAKSMVQFVDLGTKKFAVKTEKAKIDSALKENVPLKITETKETKVIAGYTSTKYIAEDEEGNEFIAYFTKDILGTFDNWDGPQFYTIKGLAMEFEQKVQGGTMKFTVTNVKKEPVKVEDFNIPAEFKLATEAEIRAEFEKMKAAQGQH